MHQYTSIVWRLAAKPQVKLVLLYLLDRADRLGICWPSLNTIARDTGLSRSSVIRSLRSLVALGLVSWEPQEDRATNLYHLNLKALGSIPQTPPSVPQTPPSISETLPSVPQTLGWCPTDTTLVSHRHPNQSFNQPLNHPKNQQQPPPISPPMTGPDEPRPSPIAAVEGGEPEPPKPTTPNREASQGTIPIPPAVVAGTAPAMTLDQARTALEEHIPRRIPPPPQVPGEMVRELRDAGLWERLSSLRRYARDTRSWHEWLAGPIAGHWRRLGPAFVQALGDALSGLASRPDLARPMIWLERQLERATPPPLPQPEDIVERVARAPTLDEAIEEFLAWAREVNDGNERPVA